MNRLRTFILDLMQDGVALLVVLAIAAAVVGVTGWHLLGAVIVLAGVA